MSNTVKIVGVRLAVNDADKFNAELKKSQSALKLAAAELKKTSAQCKADENSTAALTEKQQALTSSLQTQKEKTELLNQILEEARKNYDDESTQVQAVLTDLANSEAAEADLEAQLKETNTQLAEQTNKLKNAGSQLDSAGAKAQKWGDKISSFGGKVTAGTTVPIAALATSAVAAFNELDDGYDTIIKKTGATGDAYKQMESIAKDVYTSMPVDMSDVGAAVGELNTRLDLQGDALKTATELTLQFARVNDADAESSIQKVTRYMGDASIEASEYSNVLDNLTVASQKTGISVDTLADYLTKYGAPLRALGFETEESIALFSQWEKSGVNVEIAFSGMKTAIGNWSKEGKDSREEFKKTLQEIEACPDIASATTKAIEVFGKKAGPDLADAIQGGRFAYEDLLTVIESSEGTLSGTYNELLDGADDAKVALNNAKATLSELGDTILTSAAPVIEDFTECIKKLGDWYNNLDKGTQKTIVKTGAFIALLGPGISLLGKVTKAGGSVIKGTGKLVTWLGKLQKSTVVTFGALSVALAASAKLYEYNKQKLEEYAESVSRISTAMSDFQSGVNSAKSVLSEFDNTMSSSQIATIDDNIAATENKVLEISQTAAAEARKITDAEAAEIERLIGLIDDYCAQKIVAYTEQQDVVAAMINNETNMTATAAHTYIASAADAYNQIIAQAQQQRTEMYADAAGDKELQEAADNIYNETINGAMVKYGESLDAVAQKYYAQNIATDESISKIVELAAAAQEAQKAYDDYAASSDMSYDTLTTTYLPAVNETQAALENALANLSDEQATAFGNYISMAGEAEMYVGKAQTQAGNMVDAVATATEGVPEDIKQTFVDAMQGAINGLKEKEPDLYKKATGIANGVISRLNKAFDIHSPSRVMRKMFGYVGQGGVLGLEDEESNFYKIADRISGGVTDRLNSEARTKLAKAVPIDWSEYAHFGSIAAAQARAAEAARQYNYNSSYRYSNDDNRQYTDAGIHIGSLVVTGSDEQSLDSQLELIEEKRSAAARARGNR